MTISEVLEGLKFIQDGKINFRRIGVVTLCIVGLLMLRIATTGNVGSGRVLAHLERELINDYKIEIYKKHGYYDERPIGTGLPQQDKIFPAEDFQDLDVEFSNVSMSAPITSWSIQEEVIVRFDYVLKSAGESKQHGRKVYKAVPGSGNSPIRNSGPFLYYLHYLF